VRRAGATLVAGSALGFAARKTYRLLASGPLTLDIDVGRRLQPLGPLQQTIRAPQEVVFDVIAGPYLGKTPRALADKLHVWEHGSDMVLAAHFTHVKCGVTTTLETVRFQRPDRIDFRLVRGPVPHLAESFLLTPNNGDTELRWQGELGTDLLGDRPMVGRTGRAIMGTRCPDITARTRRRSRTPHTHWLPRVALKCSISSSGRLADARSGSRLTLRLRGSSPGAAFSSRSTLTLPNPLAAVSAIDP
jgi:hypothetical protein